MKKMLLKVSKRKEKREDKQIILKKFDISVIVLLIKI